MTDKTGALSSNPRDDIPGHVRDICTAYESGFGDGVDRKSKKNPYEPWTGPWFAWAHGVRCGMAKRPAHETSELALTRTALSNLVAARDGSALDIELAVREAKRVLRHPFTESPAIRPGSRREGNDAEVGCSPENGTEQL